MTFKSNYSLFSPRNRVILVGALVFLVSVSPNNFIAFAQSPAGEERRVNRVKSRADAAVEITAVRNLQDKDWLEQLEVEVKNLTNKRVYYLEIYITLPGVVSTGADGVPRRWGITLRYGRSALMKESPTSDDEAIQPGKSHVFKIPQENRQILQSRLASGAVPASAVRSISMRVYEVSFGDGTGFMDGGIPFP